MPAYVMLVTCQQYTVLARRTDRQGCEIRFRFRNELLQCFGLNPAADHQHSIDIGNHGNRHEVFDGIVAQTFYQVRTDRHHA